MNIRTKDNLVVIVAGIGMLLSTLDTGIINVALPFGYVRIIGVNSK